MGKNIRQSMRISIVHFMAYPSTMAGEGPILESVDELVADDFFDVVEMTQIKDATVRAEAVHRIHSSGMQLAYACQPIILGGKLNLHSRDGEERKTALDRILKALEEAVEMNAVGFAVMSGPDPGEAGRDEETKLFIDSLDAICKRAGELKPEMAVVVETFDRVPFGKNCLVGPTKEAAAMAKQVESAHPQFGLMLDLSHLPLLGEVAKDALPLAAPHLKHAHVGNCVMKNPENPYYGDNHPPFDYEGGENGLDELVDYLEQLKAIGYLSEDKPPIVGIEIKPLSDAVRPVSMGNMKRYMNRAFQRIDRTG